MEHAPPDVKVFLVGFMGTGKTTLGRLLADRLGWEFVDVDDVIEQAEGASIVRIFVEKGESYFREIERGVLAGVLARSGHAVIACGGGTFCIPENQALMERSGITVWLDRPFDRIWQRREELASARPLLRSEAEVRALYERRLAFYQQAALHVPVAEQSLPSALEYLLRLLRERFCIQSTS